MASQWSVKNIIFVSLVCTVVSAALLEWFLWLMAFLYCFAKVFQKAETTATRASAFAMMFIFTLIRLAFLPVILISLPLPDRILDRISSSSIAAFQYFSFWSFSILLTVPWLLCIYQITLHTLGGATSIETPLNEAHAPKVVVVVPCYKELPNTLLRTIDSLAECNYPAACIHVFLSFDGDKEDDMYLNTLQMLGIPLVRSSGFPSSIDIVYKETRITVSRFPHGGKRHCQKQTFDLIEKVYAGYMSVKEDMFILFIDSDCIMDRDCVKDFIYEIELKPGSEQDKLAMTGVITCTAERTTLITLMQDMEYVRGQLFERAVESGCGAVTCLPGALTMLRMSAFRGLAKEYFADKAEQCDDLFDYGKCHLGEDRWLTHLFMIASNKSYQIGVTTRAFCKTEAVKTFISLLKQRRRWFLGFVTNEVCMLTDMRVWKRYPLLCLIRLAQDTIRTIGLFFFIVVISLLTSSQTQNELPVGFVVIALGLNWLLMVYFAAVLGRYKMLLFPLLFVLGPFFDWTYVVYGILTAGQRTWGGPRADAGAADALTSPLEAIEHAIETGDDLNVVPETFRTAAETSIPGQRPKPEHVSLHPGKRMEGRFSVPILKRKHFRQTSSGSENRPILDDSDLEDAPRRGTRLGRNVPRNRYNLITATRFLRSTRRSKHMARRGEGFYDVGLDDLGMRDSMIPRRVGAAPPRSKKTYVDIGRSRTKQSDPLNLSG